MQAAVYEAKATLKVRDWPLPELAAGEVLVKVHYAGICGTDMMIYAGRHPRVVPPRVLGHEIVGTIVDAKLSSDSRWKPGLRVVLYPLISCRKCEPCREGHAHVCVKLGVLGLDVDGGFAEYVKAVSEQLVALPDTVTDEKAALIEPLSVAVHAVRNSSFHLGDTVLITGAGPIGNLIAQVLRAAGAGLVVVSETKKFRLELAQRLGFTAVNPAQKSPKDVIQQLRGQPFVDRVFEATGIQGAYRDAVQACKVRGEIVLVGVPKTPPEIDVLSLANKEIQTTGCRTYRPKDFEAAISLLEGDLVDVKSLITDELPLRDAQLAFDRAHNPEASLKILFVF
jgi:2-desacetyl-2-hydroxyethyl bacteriochlorophyllide A dehydrogenase